METNAHGPNIVGRAVQTDPTLLKLCFGDHRTKEMLGVVGLDCKQSLEVHKPVKWPTFLKQSCFVMQTSHKRKKRPREAWEEGRKKGLHPFL